MYDAEKTTMISYVDMFALTTSVRYFRRSTLGISLKVQIMIKRQVEFLLFY